MASCHSMSDSHRHSAEKKEGDTKVCQLYEAIYVKFQNRSGDLHQTTSGCCWSLLRTVGRFGIGQEGSFWVHGRFHCLLRWKVSWKILKQNTWICVLCCMYMHFNEVFLMKKKKMSDPLTKDRNTWAGSWSYHWPHRQQTEFSCPGGLQAWEWSLLLLWVTT